MDMALLGVSVKDEVSSAVLLFTESDMAMPPAKAATRRPNRTGRVIAPLGEGVGVAIVRASELLGALP
jgi:hypothetical protein